MSNNIIFNVTVTETAKSGISTNFDSMKEILTNISTTITEIESIWTSSAQSAVSGAFKSDLEDIEALKNNFDEHNKFLINTIELYKTADKN